MRRFAIPDDLVQLLSERRVIPFIGAGFSSTHAFPGWNDMLRQVARDVDVPLGFDDIHRACNGDPLQIAEYLFLIAGGTIGPLRHSLSGQLRASQPLLESSPHVDIVNLGAPQVYTTNYDDLIEQTYRLLGQKVEVVALPRDVAMSHGDKSTQVVKYHGDLRHEQTLVLTESQYYTRLDFESPMDLKFRSDLLGRAVLFMGYSFQDINIRIIWFKLMQMMKDVPQQDRMASYIVRFEPNEVLETLYAAVGLKTIVIDPDATATTPEARNALFSEFMFSLSMRASGTATIPLTGEPMFISRTLLTQLREAFGDDSRRGSPRPLFVVPGITVLIDHLSRRRLPDDLKTDAQEVFARLIGSSDLRMTAGPMVGTLILRYSELYGPSRALTRAVAWGLLRAEPRALFLERLAELDWSRVWQQTLTSDDAEKLVAATQTELESHEEGEVDEDLAYGIDIISRIAAGDLTEEPLDVEFVSRAQELVQGAAALYPAAADYEPKPDGPPDVATLLWQIQQRSETVGATADDDIPF